MAFEVSQPTLTWRTKLLQTAKPLCSSSATRCERRGQRDS